MANKDGLWLTESFQNLDSTVEPHPEKSIYLRLQQDIPFPVALETRVWALFKMKDL